MKKLAAVSWVVFHFSYSIHLMLDGYKEELYRRKVTGGRGTG